MASESNPGSEHQQHLAEKEEDQQQQLKYLEFVQIATVQALMRCAILYSYAKDHTGPLKPGVQTVEEAVKSVIGPVYDKFHLVPDELLRYVDRKVDESVTAAQKAPMAARARVADTASELAKTVYSKCEPAAKELYAKYEPKAEQCAVSAWRRLNQLPMFPRVANVVLPKAAYCTEKYNQTVVSAAEKGYMVLAYLPLVPTEKIATIFSEKKEA